VEQNKGAAGVDGMQVDGLRPYLKAHWLELRQLLLSGAYKPSPVRRHEIPKPGGGVRLLGIPTALDRFVQQAVLQVLTPLFEPIFSEHSYGFRPGKSAQQAVEAARGYIEEGYGFVVDMDLSKFFDRVNHDIVMAKVARVVGDKSLLKLIRAFLKAGVMVNGVCKESEEGTPQGGPLSPLLANIMLNDLDWELEKRGHRFARYADDCNIYVKSRRAGERVMAGVRRYVEGKLKLKVNEEKSAVDRPWKRKFLGFSFIGGAQPRIRIANKTRERFEERIREITNRSDGRSIASRIRELNSYLRGWMGYFRIAQTPSVYQELDQWIRRRLRMCLLKQWKKPKTVRRNLVALGIPLDWARNISGSRKAYWRLANTPQVNKALGLAYWRTQGLVALTELFTATP
jgi:group II intron reverse transcriptase/maturase